MSILQTDVVVAGDQELLFTHDFTLYDQVVRVLLVVRMPATQLAQQVRLMDIVPTVLDLLG